MKVCTVLIEMQVESGETFFLPDDRLEEGE